MSIMSIGVEMPIDFVTVENTGDKRTITVGGEEVKVGWHDHCVEVRLRRDSTDPQKQKTMGCQ